LIFVHDFLVLPHVYHDAPVISVASTAGDVAPGAALLSMKTIGKFARSGGVRRAVGSPDRRLQTK
jgi:hypothetical protein